jgi:hypothetical protein
MSWLQRLLTRRAGEEELPADVGPDPYPDIESEEDEIAEIDAVEALFEQPLPEPEPPPQPVLHLTDADFLRAANELKVEIAAIRAVAEVESNGRGFLPDKRPVILFEAHIYGRLTNHRHSNARDSRGRPLSTRSWDRTTYGAAGAWQHDGRLLPAARLNWDAAHKAASWGAFQILGTNHRIVGHPTIRSMVEAANSGAGAHLDMLVKFIRENKLDGHLRPPFNWEAFARGYNGPGFRQNAYHTKLATAYRKWSAR